MDKEKNPDTHSRDLARTEKYQGGFETSVPHLWGSEIHTHTHTDLDLNFALNLNLSTESSGYANIQTAGLAGEEIEHSMGGWRKILD